MIERINKSKTKLADLKLGTPPLIKSEVDNNKTILKLKFKLNAIYIDNNINLLTNIGRIEEDQYSTSKLFYDSKNKSNVFNNGNDNGSDDGNNNDDKIVVLPPKKQNTRFGSHSNQLELDSTCYSPIMIHSYLSQSSSNELSEKSFEDEKIKYFDVNYENSEIVEKELILDKKSLNKNDNLPDFLNNFTKYDINAVRDIEANDVKIDDDKVTKIFNQNSISLQTRIHNDENENKMNFIKNNYNFVIQIYLTMLSEYSVKCGVDFGKITLNLFDLYYLFTEKLNKAHGSNNDGSNSKYSFKSLNNLILTNDNELFLFLDIFPLIFETPFNNNHSHVINSDSKNVYFKGNNLNRLTKNHVKIVLSLNILEFSLKTESNRITSNIMQPSIINKNLKEFSMESMNKMFLISNLFRSRNEININNEKGGKLLEENNRKKLINSRFDMELLSLEQIGIEWDKMCQNEINCIRKFMLEYKILSSEFDKKNMGIYMDKSNCIQCITTPSQNVYYNTNISFPIFSYVIEKPFEINRLTNEKFWKNILYHYAKHYLIESPKWINKELNSSTSKVTKTLSSGGEESKKIRRGKIDMNYDKLREYERNLPETKNELEMWIIEEFLNIFYKSKIEERISHVFNMIMFHVHVYLEYNSDYTISEQGSKDYIEIFGDANKLGSGDCEDLTKAGFQFYQSFMKKKFISGDLTYMQMLLSGYIPLLLVEGSRAKNLDSISKNQKDDNDDEDDDDKDNQNFDDKKKGKMRIPPEITDGHSSLKLIPIIDFYNMINNWNKNESYQINKILKSEYEKFKDKVKNNEEFFNYINKNNLPILIGEGTGMLESGTLLDEEAGIRVMVNACVGVEKFKKKMYLPNANRYTSPFYVALLFGVTNYFIEKGFNQGYFYFAFKNFRSHFDLSSLPSSPSYEEDDDKQQEILSSSSSTTNNLTLPATFGKGVLYSDFMKRDPNVTIIPNLSPFGKNINEIQSVDRQKENEVMKIIKTSIVNRSPLPVFDGEDLESSDVKFAPKQLTFYKNLGKLTLQSKKVINSIPSSSSKRISIVSHYVFEEYIDDITLGNITNYFRDWNSIVFNQENTSLSLNRKIEKIKKKIKDSKLFLMDIQIHLEYDSNKRDMKKETCLNHLGDFYRFDFVIGRIN